MNQNSSYNRDPRQQSQRSEGYYGRSNQGMPSESRPMMSQEHIGHMRGRDSQRFDYQDSRNFDDRDRWQQDTASEWRDAGAMRNNGVRGRKRGIGNGGFGRPEGREDGNRQGYGEDAQGRWQSERSYRGAGPRDYHRSDERIREDVCDRLTEHSAIDASDIEVKVEDGEVTLEGSVEGRYMKHLAEDVAAGCSGVRDVQNRLKVQRTDASQRSGHGNGSPERSANRSPQEESTRV